jgi:uncharacterized protein
MPLLFLLIITEILMLIVLRQHFYYLSKSKYYLSIIIHVILSLWVWFIFVEMYSYNSFYDNPRHIWLMMTMTALIIATVIPRIIIIILHFTGRLINIKKGGHSRGLTNSGFATMGMILIMCILSAYYWRFNFQTEEVTIKINGLKKDLDGLKIVQLSDMHLSSFYHNNKALQEVMDKVNKIKPDLLLNTGDFVTAGWREFGRYDTILSRAKSKYGNFAILGNHDFGTYQPFYTEADKNNNVKNMNYLVQLSGYKVLNDENTILRIGDARIAIIGVETKGAFPHIIHGDLKKATAGIDSVDLKLLLSHDPNHWAEAVEGKTDINITFSGHTHGMQMGILTKKLRWSPAKYFYPHWNGLYVDGNQYHYVNRGLGLLSMPYRIWMPPEITIITLKRN